MNDTELDEMLNQWKAPEPGAELRERVRDMKPRRQWRLSWPSWHMSKGLFAGLAAGAVMCLFGIVAAFPQALASSGVRFNLISEYLAYHDDGTFTVHEHRASTARNGQEIILDRDIPGDALMSMHMHFFDTIHRWFGMSDGPTAIAGDCSVPEAAVIGHETVLGYKTIVLRYPDEEGGKSRYTEWRSPELDCIVMKSVTEKAAAGGGFRIAAERRPLTVRMNHAQ